MSSGTIATVLAAALFSAAHASYSSPENNLPLEAQQLRQDLDVCVVYTVVEQPVIISTCVPENTVIIIDECTIEITITDAPTCVLTTLTVSSTLTPPKINNNVATPPIHIGTNTPPVPPSSGIPPSPLTPSGSQRPSSPEIPPATSSTPINTPPVPPKESSTTESNTPPTETSNSIPPSEVSSTPINTQSQPPLTTTAPTFTPPPPETTISSFTLPSETASPPFTPSPPESSESIHQTNTLPIESSTLAYTPSQLPIASSTEVTQSITPATIPTTNAGGSSIVPTTTGLPTPISTDGFCGSRNGATCQGSIYGNCCSGEGECGHTAEFCGNGCQPTYGYCSSISNDGTCGNGVTCLGSIFGDCCSEFFFCGTGDLFCLLPGCQLAFGICYPPVPPSVSSNSVIPTSSELGPGTTSTALFVPTSGIGPSTGVGSSTGMRSCFASLKTTCPTNPIQTITITESGQASQCPTVTTPPSTSTALATLDFTSTSTLLTVSATSSCNPPSAFILSIDSTSGQPYYLYDAVKTGDDYLELTHDLSLAAVFSLTDDLGTPNQLRFAYLDANGSVVILYSEQDIPGSGNQPVFFATAEFYTSSGFVPVVAQINADCTLSLSLPFNGADMIAVCPGCAGCIPPVLWLLSNARLGCIDVVLNIGTPPLPTPTSALPSSTPTSACEIPPPGPTPPGTTTHCCEFLEIKTGDTCISLELQLGLDALLFVLLNPNIDSDCSNLLLGFYYCIRGTPDPIGTSSTIVSPASPTSSSLVLPTSFNIGAFDSGTVVDGVLADGGLNPHEYIGFNLPFGEEILLFNYDIATGYINVDGSSYILHAAAAGFDPPVVVTYLLGEDPSAFPLECSISSNLNITCTADGGLYHIFKLAADLGSPTNIVLTLGDGTGTFIAPVSLFIVNGNY